MTFIFGGIILLLLFILISGWWREEKLGGLHWVSAAILVLLLGISMKLYFDGVEISNDQYAEVRAYAETWPEVQRRLDIYMQDGEITRFEYRALATLAESLAARPEKSQLLEQR